MIYRNKKNGRTIEIGSVLNSPDWEPVLTDNAIEEDTPDIESVEDTPDIESVEDTPDIESVEDTPDIESVEDTPDIESVEDAPDNNSEEDAADGKGVRKRKRHDSSGDKSDGGSDSGC